MTRQDSAERPRVLIAGCGKLGGAVARLLSPENRVYGLRRHPEQVPTGVTGIRGDLTRPETLSGVLPEAPDVVIYCLTPSSYDEAGYHNAYVAGLRNLLAELKPGSLKRLVFVSSTSVYSQNDDEWVDETSETRPARFSGQQVLAGEQLALDSGHPATIVRFSGIYGPGRMRFLEEVMAGRMDPASPAPFSNRIHEDDAAEVLAWVTRKALDGKPLDTVYLASDDRPVRLDEVVHWVREQVPCQAPEAQARRGGRAGSKRCSNRRLRDSGFTFRYPDYQAGYREMIRALS